MKEEPRYRIKSLIERDFETDEPLYWANDLGWVDRESATCFTRAEMIRAQLVGPWESDPPLYTPDQEMSE